MWDTVSMLIGVFIGMFLAFIITSISYYNRFFIFTACPGQEVRCRSDDYYTDPGDAIANGANSDDILFLDASGDMLYKQVPKTQCSPGPSQDTFIKDPQYCIFTDDNGDSFEAKNQSFGSTYYTSTSKKTILGHDIDVTTSSNCDPVRNSGGKVLVGGSAELKWDSNSPS